MDTTRILKSIFLSFLATCMITGCSNTGLGVATGGVIGGVAGNAITGGSAAGTIVGAVGGAAIGGALSSNNN